MIQKCVIILVTKPGTYVQAKPKEEKKEETKKHEKEPEGPPDYYRMFKDRYDDTTQDLCNNQR